MVRVCYSDKSIIVLIGSVLQRENAKPFWKPFKPFSPYPLPVFSAGISSILFDSRIGCLDPVVPMETERFIQSINTMFVMTLLTMAMPAWLHQLFPKPWDTFCQCWDYMFQFGELPSWIASYLLHLGLIPWTSSIHAT